ncbi:MAG: hypothetical protein J6X88_01285, partial [Bacteroidales bacterium]|nr:hypothetical protein [Bacteroidales bacterium]
IMNTFFEEEGLLNIDDLIMEQPSFQKILEDGVVTDEELQEQSARVIASLKAFEQSASSEQIDKVREILAEVSVLVAVREIYEKQEVK